MRRLYKEIIVNRLIFNQKTMKSRTKIILLLLLISSPFIIVALMWIFSIPRLLEISWDRLWEVHFEIGDYKLWKQMWGYNLCNKKEWCFNWEVKWFKKVWEDIYIYIYI